MRITGRQLRRIIQEEVARMMNEEDAGGPSFTGTVTQTPLVGGSVSVDMGAPTPVKAKPTAADMNANYEEAFSGNLKSGAPGVWALEHLTGIPDTIKSGQASFAVQVGTATMRANAIKMLGLDIDGASADQKMLDQINNAVPVFRDRKDQPADMKVLVKFTAVPSAGAGPQRSVRVTSVKFF